MLGKPEYEPKAKAAFALAFLFACLLGGGVGAIQVPEK